MDRAAPPAAGTAEPSSGRAWLLWTALFLALVGWQGWMTLTLFGDDDPWQRLLSDEPIISGRHPLHLYHGYLGAQAFLHSGRLSCYDPAFQAGYPKTPVFDSGSRPAELFLTLAGGQFRPDVYKVGLAVTCLLVPFALLAAARAVGLGAAASVLASAAGVLVWWGAPGRRALEAGDIELLIAGLAVLAHVGLLLRFHRAPGLLSWLGMLLTGGLGWFAQPLLFPILLPLLLLYYLSIGTRHPSLTWHAALLTSQAGAVALNAFWLSDWINFWWLRSPLPQGAGVLPHRTLQTLWDAPLWGEAADRNLAILLLFSAAAGVWVLNQTHQRVAARLLGVGAGGLCLLAVLGIAWEPLGQVGTAGLLVPGLWFACLPAAYAWAEAGRLLRRLTGSGGWAAALAAAGLLVAGLLGHDTLTAFAERCVRAQPLALGLGPDRLALVQTLREQTTAEARILWEDRPAQGAAPRWSVLLPVLTGRSFVGGLDPDAGIEHTQAGLVEQTLAGRHVTQLGDEALEAYCWRYNVGWVVCWSEVSAARFRAWGKAVEIARLTDGGTGYLFRIERPELSFALKGKARVIHADAHHITLADVVPENGKVVLSFHYQAGLTASPGRVQVEREPDAHDPVPFIRLRVASPVARVTLRWEESP
jgi:hypothetical protein